MSAFVVGHDHIDGLLTFALAHSVSYWTGRESVTIARDNVSEIGRLLLDENEQSVGFRYGEHDPEDMPGTIGEQAANYQFRAFAAPIPPIVILKACDCYDYQACEHDGWESSVAKRIVDAIRGSAVRRLPDWDKAAGWQLRR